MKVAVISSDYPSSDLLYGDVFVHTRLRQYQKQMQVAVTGVNENLPADRVFTNEGIDVHISNTLQGFYQQLRSLQADVIVCHFLQFRYLDFLQSLRKPLLIFAHGYDTTSWRRRLMNYDSIGSVRYLIPYMLSNMRQLKALRSFIRSTQNRPDVHFVYVSEWLRQAAQEDLGLEVKQSSVIANGIDTTRFSYTPKNPELRKRILLLRSFKAVNYGNDLAVQTILKLRDKPFFSELSFRLQGEGYLFPRLTECLREFPNIELVNSYSENKDIPGIHQQYGLFLCPSRLDSQGVSMCEAMSSGLVPLTTPVGGIPEFVTHGTSGFMENSAGALAQQIEHLYYHPDQFLQMSQNARRAIETSCAVTDTTAREIELIQALYHRS
jgi:glycosyltransferase involved in cell wall biosynthesis